MKKFLIAIVVVVFSVTVSSASIIIQTQANTMGKGVGVGFSMNVVPVLLDLGIEGSTALSPWSYYDKGSYTDDVTKQKVDYAGSISWKGSRYGVFAKLNLFLITPIIRAGTQQGTISLDGDIRVPGEGFSVDDLSTLSGSYVSLGIPFYLGPVFTEISIGTQSIYIPHFMNVTSVTDVQVAFGLSFF
jgi:hypothetical protein